MRLIADQVADISVADQVDLVLGTSDPPEVSVSLGEVVGRIALETRKDAGKPADLAETLDRITRDVRENPGRDDPVGKKIARVHEQMARAKDAGQ